ncbi:MAG: insulinase family protein [Deltaproteobacteria bacterium]|nr:insulinase family protein [Deltaproteobacteria bacterium]
MRFRLPFNSAWPLKNGAVFSFSLIIFLSSIFIPGAAAFVDRSEIVSRTLPNGLEVLVREDPGQTVAELQVWVGAGGRDEPKGKEGIAHLFEHMLFKGTATRKVGEIASTVEAAGGDINAYTSMDNTVYHITIASSYFETGMDVLSDAVQHSSFDKGELEKEKLVVIEEIHRGEDSPPRVFSEELFKAAYPKHPYGRKVIGTPASVKSISRRDMLAFFKHWYVPGNMKLVVVGNVKAGDVFRSAAAHFNARGGAIPRRKEVAQQPQTQSRIFHVQRDTDPARVALAFHIVALKDPEEPVYDLLAAILSQGESSRLPVNLRDKGIVHAAWAYAYTPKDPGLFILGATVDPERIGDALRGLLEQLAILREKLIPSEEIERARSRILNGKIFERERVEGQAREIGYMALTLDNPNFDDIYRSRIQAVDAGDLRAAARRVFSGQRATVGFLSRDVDAQPGDSEVRDLLNGKLAPAAHRKGTESVPAVYRSNLPNGLTLLVREDHRLPLVAARVGVLGGVRFETERTQGAFNLIAHLLTRGTRQMSATELALKLDGMSASLDGFSGRNSFGVTGKFLSRDIGEGLKLMGQVLTDATLPAHELDLARERMISAIKARKDNMEAFAMDLFRTALFKEHPYRFSTLGTEESVSSLTRDDLVKIYRNEIRPEGMVLSLTGDIRVEDAYRLAEKTFGGLSGGKFDPGPLPMEVPRGGKHVVREVRGDKAQTHLMLGYLGPTLYSPDLDSLDVLNAVLAGQGGRLFTELRDRRSLAYSVFSFVAPGIDPGFIAFGIGVSPAREQEALDGILEQIRLVRDQPVSPAEIERAKTYLIGSKMIELQDLGSRNDEVFFPVLYGEDLERALHYPERIRSVTPRQIQEAARRYLDPGKYTLVVLAGGASVTGPE